MGQRTLPRPNHTLPNQKPEPCVAVGPFRYIRAVQALHSKLRQNKNEGDIHGGHTDRPSLRLPRAATLWLTLHALDRV